MALTEFQRTVCQLLAAERRKSGESDVAGGAALNEALGASRLSRDMDLFHDTQSALEVSWQADRQLLTENGYLVKPLRERSSYVEAVVERDGESVVLEWVRDSAFRFFPLVEHPTFGLTLHPFDLATNKVLALVGRLEVRDWVDMLGCCERLQPLGYLAWAACGKDPGFSPAAILDEAARSSRYSAAEVAMLAFEGNPPDAAELSRRWRVHLAMGREIIATLPGESAGSCVLTGDGRLCQQSASDLRTELANFSLIFHRGSIRSAFPQTRGHGSERP